MRKGQGKRIAAAGLAGILAFAGCGGQKSGEGTPDLSENVKTDGTEDGEKQGMDVTPTPDADSNDMYKAYEFDPSVTYQTVDGFGAAYTWYADWLFNTQNPDGVLDALFSDAKLTVLRFKNEYEYNAEGAAPNTLTMLRCYEAAKERAAEYGRMSRYCFAAGRRRGR